MPHFQFPVHSKLPKFGTTIFTVMSEMAIKYNAVNLSQGFPDFEVNPELIRLTEQYMRAGKNQYTHMAGYIGLREQLALKTEQLYGTTYSPENEITITAGATQAIYTAITALVSEGDEVIIFTPAYDCYQPAVELNGGKCVFVQLSLPEYKIDWEQVKKMVNRKTKLIIINSPHNPTGAILEENDLKQLKKITADSGIVILSDEVYEHMVFDGKKHLSLASDPQLSERSIIVSSFGKTFHNTGWKVGYALAPSELIKEFRKVHQYLVFSVNTPVQFALADFLNFPNYYLELSAFYEQKRNYFLSLIKDSLFKPVPCKGTYFQLLNYELISDKKDTDFAIELIEKYKIAAIPVSVFYHKEVDAKVLRFCFAKSNETLEKAAEILNAIKK